MPDAQCLMPSTPPNLCILGSLNMDLVVRAPRLPAPGETLIGGEPASIPGGKGANQAVAASRHAAVSMIGAVGDDAKSEGMRQVLADNQIGATNILTRAGVQTGLAIITVSESDSQNTIIVSPGANGTLSPADVEAAGSTIAAADVLLMQLESPMPAVIRAAQLAKEAGVTVMLNAAPASKLPWDLLAGIDVLIVNQSEAAAILAAATMGTDPDEIAKQPVEQQLDLLERLGVSCIVMTLGAEGAAFSRAREVQRVPAFPVTPIDTVGAGDAFCGMFAARWAEHQIAGGIDNETIKDAVTWACAAGALATMKRGAIPAMPMRAEVVKLLCGR
ncbi:MAG: ribokinase [Phycisphaerales bacterium]|nr:ribokinase [Phycisphaerales bacterium]